MLVLGSCIAFKHNLWLVLVAGGVCVLGCWVQIELFNRAIQAKERRRLGWQILAATSAGASIWCTHFVAILAYQPGVPIGFDAFLTITSALIACLGAGLAFVVALWGRSKTWALAGGAILGLAISAMHYTGMLAYRIEGLVGWSVPTLIASVAIAVVFGACSLYLAVHGALARRQLGAVAWLVATILGLHFTGMAALKITPLEIEVSVSNAAAISALALAIVGMTLLVICTGIVTYLIDDDTRADSLKRLRDLALHDGLTALPNRTCFREFLTHLLEEAAQGPTKIHLVSIDLDGFKDVNDQFGHATGDAVLKRVAERLQKALLPSEFAARVGGDEFAVVRTSEDGVDVGDLVDRIAAVIALPCDVEKVHAPIGASMGIATFPDNAGDLESLVNNADLAMYRAKSDRDTKICFFEQTMDDQIRERRRMASDLRSAIANNELEVYYQAQVAVTSGAIQGFEALARWRRASQYIPPSEFIPIAEEFGLIDELGYWVMKTACTEAALWEPAYRVAVNLSPTQLRNASLTQTVASVLRETGLAPSRLELELPESAIIRDAKSALRAMRKIRELGVTLALDDFGTGYSSLSTLQTFPFDKIKLDRSFLRGIETSAQSKAILKAVLALGDGLGIPVLTEGVETPGQLSMLRAEGCSQAQGYLTGRPAPMSLLLADGVLALKPARAALKQLHPERERPSAA